MRDARFVGLTSDGQALIVEHAGEHLRVPIDDDVRSAVRGQSQMPIALEPRVSPRELQQRIRSGESAADIAAVSGVSIELIARFEGPVLAERTWHVEQARRTQVDGMTLEDRVAATIDAGTSATSEPVWDAWTGEEGGWRISARLPDGRRAVWTWNHRTRRLRGTDDFARYVLSGDVAANDLEAVLRPIAAARHLSAAPPAAGGPPAPSSSAGPPAQAAAGAAAGEDDETEDEPAAENAPPAAAPPAPQPLARRRRPQVPAWDDIVLGTPRRTTDDPAG